jgi:THO complex subunit 1
MRSEIASYLQQGVEGKLYFRMVDTVLSRDKNWIFWKAESCPNISKRPVQADQFTEAQDGIRKSSANKRLRPAPLGAIDLDFLDANPEDGLAKLATPSRYRNPAAADYQAKIMNDEMDMDMARTDEEKAAAAEARSSKIWRSLRIASRSRFKDFDKVDDGKNIDVLFKTPQAEDEVDLNKDVDGGENNRTDDNHETTSDLPNEVLPASESKSKDSNDATLLPV